MDMSNKQPETPNKKRSEGWSAFGLVSAIGIDLAICTIGGTYLGLWLDEMWGTEPWMLLVGIILGLTAGILGIVKLISVFGPENKPK